MICIAAIAFVPYAFTMDFVFMLPGFILAIGTWLRRDRYWQLALLGWLALDLFLVVGVHCSWGEYQYWFIPWIGLIMTIVMLRLRRVDRERTPHIVLVFLFIWMPVFDPSRHLIRASAPKALLP